MSTSAAATKAAKSLGGSSRNRPSLSMSQQSGDSTPGANSSGAPSIGGAPSLGNWGSEGAGPLFMDNVQSQFESLSEKLMKENENENPPPKKGKVRWAETAALASTMDVANTNNDDGKNPPRSPMEVVSGLFQQKYTIPTFLAMAAGIFLLVHVTGGLDDEGSKIYGGLPTGTTTSSGPGRDFNVGGGDGFGDITFAFPTISPGDGSHYPTMEAISHITPKIPGQQPSKHDGNDPDWILVPTSSHVYGPGQGSPVTLKWNYPPGYPTPNPALLADMGSPVTLKWNFPPGHPTPNPALLASVDDGSPTALKWGVGGRPVDKASPTALAWGYPPGVPTPNPALLVEVASPHGGPDKGSPTTLKWNIPYGQPTPDPANLDAGSPTTLQWAFGPKDPDAGGPTTLKWGYPPGVPTPNPALLTAGSDSAGMAPGFPGGAAGSVRKSGLKAVWPELFNFVANCYNLILTRIFSNYLYNFFQPTNESVGWGYPPGVPTPNPALLVAGSDSANDIAQGAPPGFGPPGGDLEAGEDTETGSWGYPPGEPTPNPALLNSPSLPKKPTEAPTVRKVEVGVLLTPLTASPVSGQPTKKTDEGVSLKMPDMDDSGPGKAPPGMDDPGLAPPGMQPTDTETFDDPGKAPPGMGDPGLAPPGMQPTDTEVFDDPGKAPPGMDDPGLAPPGMQPTDTEVFDDPGKAPPGMDGPGLAPPGMAPADVEVIDEPGLAPPLPIDTKVIQDPGLAPPGMAPAGMAPAGMAPAFDYNGNPVEVAPPPPPVPPAPAYPASPRPPRPASPPRPPGWSSPQRPPSPQVNYQPYSGPSGFTMSQGVMGGPNGYNIPGGQGHQVVYSGFGGGGWNVGAGTGGYMLPMNVQYMPLIMPMNVPIVPQMFATSLAPTPVPGCPGVEECIVDETVPTMGRSNEDDAVYEIFYTNPLKCCGTFIEIGAGNGKQHSPSYFFQYGMNWTTILTEADPLEFGQIADNRSGEKVRYINGAFCLEGPHMYYDAMSRHFQSINDGEYTSEITNQDFEVTDTTRKINCTRLDSDVLSDVDHVDVMVIRVKGDPWAVVRTMDWDVQVDIWVILMEEDKGYNLATLRTSLDKHDYVPAAWDIKLWCDTPAKAHCSTNEVWLRKSFNPLPKPLLGSALLGDGDEEEKRGLRGVANFDFSAYSPS